MLCRVGEREREHQVHEIVVIRHAALSGPPYSATSAEPVVAHEVNEHRANERTTQLAPTMSPSMANILLLTTAVLAVLTANTAVTACFRASPAPGEWESMRQR